MANRNGGKAGKPGPEMVQLATRVPKRLHLRLRMHCLKQRVSVMNFLIPVIEAGLDAAERRAASTRAAS